MKLIKPSNISGEIMTLMEEADEKVILVSPYCKFREWRKLTNKFKDLQSRNIEIEFYVRAGEHDTISEVEALNISPITIPRLHAKLYLNEKNAIVSSMNLTKSSDDASLDIGYKTETKEEYLELVDYYERYILKHKQKDSTPNRNSGTTNQNFGESLRQALSNTFKRRVNLRIDKNELEFNTGSNRYHAFITNSRPSHFVINEILSNSEFEKAVWNKKELEKNIGCPIELNEGKDGYYDTIQATLLFNIQSDGLDLLRGEQVNKMIDSIVRFAVEVDNFKMSCWERR